jgi:DNA mismatch repair protein MutL
VEIAEAGRKLILVADDGEGMESADLALAILRHATSKISASADLWDLHSFGFRGEALPSIASVSRLAITSRRKGQDAAWALRVEGGPACPLEPASLAQGTRVEVRDLFFNTPARLKFLKTLSTENGRIQQVLTSLALAAPKTAFTLRQDKRTSLDWPAADLAGRVRQALGAEFIDASLPLELDTPAAKVRGWVGRPHLHRGNRGGQWLFVGGRAVEHRLLNFTLAQAFGSLVPAGRFAQALIFLELPSGQVDVNVHPSKREVRFVREAEVLAALRHAVQAALGKAQLSVPLALDASRPAPPVPWTGSTAGQGSSRLFEASAEYGTQPASHQAESGWMPAPAAALAPAAQASDAPGLPLALAQLHRCYILCQSPEGLVLVDQHAGHERVLYERFLRSLERGDAGRQALLLPLKMEVGPAEAERLRAWMPALFALGLELGDLGGGAFYLMSLPAAFKQVDALPMLLDLLQGAEAEGLEDDPTAWVRREVAASLACRAAVKSGDPLTLEEMRHLVAELFRCQLPWACPHGRPPFVSVSLVELEKHFKRR